MYGAAYSRKCDVIGTRIVVPSVRIFLRRFIEVLYMILGFTRVFDIGPLEFILIGSGDSA